MCFRRARAEYARLGVATNEFAGTTAMSSSRGRDCGFLLWRKRGSRCRSLSQARCVGGVESEAGKCRNNPAMRIEVALRRRQINVHRDGPPITVLPTTILRQVGWREGLGLAWEGEVGILNHLDARRARERDAAADVARMSTVTRRDYLSHVCGYDGGRRHLRRAFQAQVCWLSSNEWLPCTFHFVTQRMEAD